MTSFTSPLRYPGGKTRSRKLLFDIINQNFNTSSLKRVISPYFGGESFEFYLTEQLGVHVGANDGFVPLYVFWNKVCTNLEALCSNVTFQRQQMTSSDDSGKSLFLSMRNTIMEEEDELKKATSYFIINRCSFSGATLSGGFSKESSNKRFTASSIERLRNIDTSKLSISNMDGVQFIESQYKGDDETLMFIDPPYYLKSKSKLYGVKGDMHKYFDHNALFECIKDKKHWMVTYNDCEFIRNLYREYKIIEASWSYGMNKTKKSCEIVIVCPSRL